jgi:7-cyano-7-deazaguanine reductase
MLQDSPLGQITVYIENYSPELLFPISRTLSRDKLSLKSPLPFTGVDIWSAYEISWLNPKGKPVVALADIYFSCESLNIVESKSFKLYINSFNQTTFESFDRVAEILEKDLANITKGVVTVDLYQISDFTEKALMQFPGTCLDTLDIETSTYQVDTSFLKTTGTSVEEILYSELLKSNCLATGQPDWGSLYIHYLGAKIDREGLLKYIISFRNHSGFAEHCVEQIFHDIQKYCKPEKLTVYARYTRRGGLDINPFRSNFEKAPENYRQIRQ